MDSNDCALTGGGGGREGWSGGTDFLATVRQLCWAATAVCALSYGNNRFGTRGVYDPVYSEYCTMCL